MTYEKQIASLKDQVTSVSPASEGGMMKQEFEIKVDQLRTELEKTHKENRELRVAIERCQREVGVFEEQTTTGRRDQPDFKTSLLNDSLRVENKQLKEKVIITIRLPTCDPLLAISVTATLLWQ